MLNTLTGLFISQAWAQDAANAPLPPGGSNTSVMMNFVPLILIFAVFYVLIIRPQQKKFDEQTKMIKALQRGDRVVTSGGVCGKIARVDGDEAVILEIADGVQIKVLKSFITGLEAKPVPVNTNENKG